MNDLNVIDRFMQAFAQYIDSGFGLLGGDIHFLTATLIGIDITLAGLFWALGGEQDVMAKFLRKILYVGAFAFIIGQFSTLADLIFRSFAAAGVTAGGGGITANDLLRPGVVASTGFTAAWPLLMQIADLTGPVAFFTNFGTIAVLFVAWALVIVAFFILSIQVFVTIIEFKLTALAGFVLVPFALWNKTSFLAERVLGAVVSAGIKVMVLGVVIGIGTNFFTEFTSSLQGSEPDIVKALSLTLAALTIFGLSIFAPGIATGLVSGAPQLGAGAALGTTLGAAGVVALGGGAAIAGARAAGGATLGAVRAGTSMGSAAGTAYKLGQETAPAPTVGAGMRGVATAAGNAMKRRASTALGIGEAADSGRKAAWHALTETTPKPQPAGGASEDGRPAWASAMQREQAARHHRHVAVQAMREGDKGGAGATPEINDKED